MQKHWLVALTLLVAAPLTANAQPKTTTTAKHKVSASKRTSKHTPKPAPKAEEAPPAEPAPPPPQADPPPPVHAAPVGQVTDNETPPARKR